MLKGGNDFLKAFNTAATISFYMISGVIAGIVVGRLFDGYLGTNPWATVAGIVLGMISGMWAIYKTIVGGK